HVRRHVERPLVPVRQVDRQQDILEHEHPRPFYALSISSCRMPLGGRSARRTLARAALAPACCSASLSSHSMLTAPSYPTRFSSIMISSTLLASRCVPAVTKFQPLSRWPIGRWPPSKPARVCSRITCTPLIWAQ